MKPTLVVIAMLFCIGCSTVKPVEIMTDKKQQWAVGQHDFCVYKKMLGCMPSAGSELVFVKAEADRRNNKVEDVLMEHSVKTMYEAERAKFDEREEVNVYDVKFSATPEDYSIWNCTKTGLGSPAVDCTLLKTPDTNEREFIAKEEKQLHEGEAASSALYSLTQEQLQQRCGDPLQKGSNSIAVFFAYKGTSKFVALEFDTIGHKLHEYQPEYLDVIGLNDNPPPTKMDISYALGNSHTNWQHGGGADQPYKFDSARAILKELPCLKK